MQIPKISHVPIHEPIYSNGIMNQVWIRFFEQLAALINRSDLADLIELMQLASQMPTQAITGQHELLLGSIQSQFSQTTALNIQHEELPPVQAVFLCSDEFLQPVFLSNLEVIAP